MTIFKNSLKCYLFLYIGCIVFWHKYYRMHMEAILYMFRMDYPWLIDIKKYTSLHEIRKHNQISKKNPHEWCNAIHLILWNCIQKTIHLIYRNGGSIIFELSWLSSQMTKRGGHTLGIVQDRVPPIWHKSASCHVKQYWQRSYQHFLTKFILFYKCQKWVFKHIWKIWGKISPLQF
jgi:hypothetical protein